MEKKRINWIDIAKGIFMFFVILSHSGYGPDLYVHIYTPFFLSGFFFTSGLFFYKPNIKYNEKLKKIIFTILIPYVIYWFISFSANKILHSEYCFIHEFIYSLLKGNKLWFASCLVVSELITLNIIYVFKHKIVIFIYPFLSLFIYFLLPYGDYYWSFRTSFLASFYLGLGIIVKFYLSQFNKIIETNMLGYISLFLYITLICIDVTYINQKGNFPGFFSNYPYFILESFLGIYVVFYLSKKIENTCFYNAFKYIGMNSLLYYFFQNQILNLTKYIGYVLDIQYNNYIYPFISTIIVILSLIIPINLINKYFKIMSGKYCP